MKLFLFLTAMCMGHVSPKQGRKTSTNAFLWTARGPALLNHAVLTMTTLNYPCCSHTDLILFLKGRQLCFLRSAGSLHKTSLMHCTYHQYSTHIILCIALCMQIIMYIWPYCSHVILQLCHKGTWICMYIRTQSYVGMYIRTYLHSCMICSILFGHMNTGSICTFNYMHLTYALHIQLLLQMKSLLFIAPHILYIHS